MATRGMTDDDMGGFVTRSANASTFAARTRASDGAFRRRARERGIERARVFIHEFCSRRNLAAGVGSVSPASRVGPGITDWKEDSLVKEDGGGAD